jgi:hypothetical protein
MALLSVTLVSVHAQGYDLGIGYGSVPYQTSTGDKEKLSKRW